MQLLDAVTILSGKTEKKGITFYSFPKNDTLMYKWIQNIKPVNLPNDPNIFHYHFESSCFKRDLQVNTYILDFNLLTFIFYKITFFFDQLIHYSVIKRTFEGEYSKLDILVI